MKSINRGWLNTAGALLFGFVICVNSVEAGKSGSDAELDKKVQEFLEDNKKNWRDLNIPYEDGKVLYDIIVKNGYKHAVEIGTSTGHSSIWIAWALSKTGGKLTTIEIDKERHMQALKNFKKAGVEKVIDARLADAHKLVKELKGPIDFVFSDADKNWYVQYFKDIHPKMKSGGCFTAHNVTMRGLKEFVEYVKAHPDYNTTIDTTSRAGISISYKK